MVKTAPSMQQVDGRSPIDNSQSNPASSASSPSMNHEPDFAKASTGRPSTINKRGFLPRLGPRQFMALLAIVAILLLIGFFVADKGFLKGTSGISGTSAPRELTAYQNKINGLVEGVQVSEQPGEDKSFKETIKELSSQDTVSAKADLLWNLGVGCKHATRSAEEKSKLQQAFQTVVVSLSMEEKEKMPNYFGGMETIYLQLCD